MEAYFCHLPNHRLLVCRSCTICVAPDTVHGHLVIHHSGTITASERRAITAQIDALEDLARTPDDLPLYSELHPPLLILPLVYDCVRCLSDQPNSTKCERVFETLKAANRHLKADHAVQDALLAQRDVNHLPFRVGVVAQCFFKTGTWPRLREVAVNAPISASQEAQSTNTATKLLEPYNAAILSRNAKRTVQSETNPFVFNAWIHCTRWREHLGQFDHASLLASLRVPPAPIHDPARRGADDAKLYWICTVLRDVIGHAFLVANPDVVGEPALRSVLTRESGAPNLEKPFYAGHRQNTIQVYTTTWVGIVCHIWRTWRRSAGGPRTTPRFVITSEQGRCLRAIHEQDPTWFDSSQTWSQRHRLVLDFLISLLDHEIVANEYESGLISALAVLGINPHWREQAMDFREPEMYTSMLSAVVTVARVLVVYAAYTPERWYAERQSSCDTTVDITQVAPPHHAVTDMCKRFMRLDDGRGTQSHYPFAWILRLCTYGRSIAMSRGSVGDVHWRDSELLMGSVSFTMERLRTTIHSLVSTTTSQLYEDLLLLTLDEFGTVDRNSTSLPALDLGSLYDQPQKRDGGWNFLSDDRNHKILGVDGRSWLLGRIALEPRLARRFFKRPTSQAKNCKPEADSVRALWIDSAITLYFQSIRRFKERLLALVHMCGGQPARSTELCSIQYCNGTSNDMRGVYIQNRMVAIVTQYHKTLHSHGRPKTIYRFCPDDVGRLVVFYLWLVQPFEHYLTWIRFHTTHFSSFLWQPYLDTSPDNGQYLDYPLVHQTPLVYMLKSRDFFWLSKSLEILTCSRQRAAVHQKACYSLTRTQIRRTRRISPEMTKPTKTKRPWKSGLMRV